MKLIRDNWLYARAKSLYQDHVSTVWKNRIELWVFGSSELYRSMFRDAGCIFIHVPKAAGFSIAKTLYGRSTGHYTASMYKQISAREFAKYYKFAFVRNPWDRAVSAYTFAKQGGTDVVQPVESEIYSSELFESFETFVINWLQYVDLLEVDLVFAPQYHFVCDNNNELIVDFVGRFENFDDDIRIVAAVLGREINIEHLNKSTKEGDFRSYYNDETRDLVAKIYQKDIELFGYSFNE